MLDIKWIRDNPEALDRALKNRGAEPAAARLIGLDEARRAAIQALQDMQTRRNAASKEIGQAKAAKDEARAASLMSEVSVLKDGMKTAEEAERAADKALADALAEIPNVPADDVPVGNESANKVERTVGAPKRIDGAKEHFDLGEALGMMDFEAAAKLSGSRFVVLKAGLARMERALGQFMLDLHTEEHGYEEVQPPVLVKDDALYGTAQLPKFAEDLFKTAKPASFDEVMSILNAATEAAVEDVKVPGSKPGEYSVSSEAYREAVVRRLGDWVKKIFEPHPTFEAARRALSEVVSSRTIDLWLIPTAEVPLTNLVRESILSEDELPRRYTALTPCFRSEAGSAGKDTRGMLRQHQFNKVELVSIATPEASRAEHERMTACAEEVLKRLGLAYRVVLLSTGDMGFASTKTWDLEVWLPGQGAYREISSCSNCGDFQARRMQARSRAKEEKQPRLVHTLNGSGVAVGRALIAVMETYQNPDGSITVPDALKPYMGGAERVG
jgi:seryl-tRNA synthetase